MARPDSKPSPYQRVTVRILEALEAGCGPWKRPWKIGALRNAATHRPYRGINTVLLTFTMEQKGFSTPLWLTFRQAQALGGQVRRGEKGTPVCFFRWVDRTNSTPPSGSHGPDDDERGYPLLRTFTVFNIAQTDLDHDAWREDEARALALREPRLERFLRQSGADIRFGGDRAYYAPFDDRIQLPAVPAFDHAGAYYATAFHELTHWTGHPDRLRRDLSGRFGDQAYAAEELVAELGSAFLCTEFGVEGHLQHPEYIGHWLGILRGDTRAIFTAASKAQQAVDLLLEEAQDPEPGSSIGTARGSSAAGAAR